MLTCVLSGALFAQSANRVMPRTQVEGSTLYPRLIRLTHGTAETRGHLLASTNGVILRSTDDGRTFQVVSHVTSLDGSKERCCATLFEMPSNVGTLSAGTLLSAASYFEGGQAAIQIYTSQDEGKTWHYLATPIKGGGPPHRGLWEPEFTISKGGALVMFWSDETDACCSQKLAQVRTFDGQHWVDPRDTVRSATRADRPGMAVVSQLNDKRYFMSYEICGPNDNCAVYGRLSQDGWDWGSPHEMGTAIRSVSGQYLEHAPTNRVLPDGRLLVSGQLMLEADGELSALNGRAVFIGGSNPLKPMQTALAPVPVPDAFANFCPNYSSAFLPTADKAKVIELASDYNANHQCKTYEGIAPIVELPSR